MPVRMARRTTVALRKESVDRNIGVEYGNITDAVALRKESVDRNNNHGSFSLSVSGRSPQGERG